MARNHGVPVVPATFTGGTAKRLSTLLEGILREQGISQGMLDLLSVKTADRDAAERVLRVLNLTRREGSWRRAAGAASVEADLDEGPRSSGAMMSLSAWWRRSPSPRPRSSSWECQAWARPRWSVQPSTIPAWWPGSVSDAQSCDVVIARQPRPLWQTSYGRSACSLQVTLSTK